MYFEFQNHDQAWTFVELRHNLPLGIDGQVTLRDDNQVALPVELWILPLLEIAPLDEDIVWTLLSESSIEHIWELISNRFPV